MCYGKIALFNRGWPSCTAIMHCQGHWPWLQNHIPDSHREKVLWELDSRPIPSIPPFYIQSVCLNYSLIHHCHVPRHPPVHLFYLSTSGTPNCISMHYWSTGDKGLNLPVRQVEPIHLEIVFCEHREAMEVTVKVVDTNWSHPSVPCVLPPAVTYVTDLEL